MDALVEGFVEFSAQIVNDGRLEGRLLREGRIFEYWAHEACLLPIEDYPLFKYRMEQWKPYEIVYVTDARQKLHFQQVFAAIAKWWPTVPDLRHVYFGSILGEDGKPLKTRSGENVKLGALLDEAEERARLLDPQFAVLDYSLQRLPDSRV